MNCSPTLSAEDFKNVHNGKCELHGVLQSIESIVHPRITERLQKAIGLLDKGLAAAYEQDDAENDAIQAHVNEVEQQLGGMKSIWSMYEVKDLRAPHPWPEHQLVSYQGWGDAFMVKVLINGPLWTDLWMAADEAIQRSGDGHHIFIENFTQSKTHDFELVLHTGS